MIWRRWLTLAGMLGLVLMVLVIVTWPSHKLEVVFCNVGQGDAALVIKGNFQLLIDGGPSESKLYDCLSNNLPFWDRQIEAVVNTHPEADHINGLIGLARRYRIGLLLVSGFSDKEGKADLLKKLVNQKAKLKEVRIGDRLRYGDLYFDIVWSSSKNQYLNDLDVGNLDKKEIDLNKSSVAGRLRYKDFSVLFTADISEEEELAMVDMGLLRVDDVLKVAHHGSKNSSSKTLLGVVRPKVAIVSVGKGNSFGHPTKEVLSRIDAIGTSLWRTDKNGWVKIVSDGEKYFVQSQFGSGRR